MQDDRSSSEEGTAKPLFKRRTTRFDLTNVMRSASLLALISAASYSIGCFPDADPPENQAVTDNGDNSQDTTSPPTSGSIESSGTSFSPPPPPGPY